MTLYAMKQRDGMTRRRRRYSFLHEEERKTDREKRFRFSNKEGEANAKIGEKSQGKQHEAVIRKKNKARKNNNNILQL